MSGQRILLATILIVIAVFLIMYYINWKNGPRHHSTKEVLQSMKSDFSFW